MSFLPGGKIPATAADLIEHLFREGVPASFPTDQAFDTPGGAYLYGIEIGRRQLVEQLYFQLHPQRKADGPIRHTLTPTVAAGPATGAPAD